MFAISDSTEIKKKKTRFYISSLLYLLFLFPLLLSLYAFFRSMCRVRCITSRKSSVNAYFVIINIP